MATLETLAASIIVQDRKIKQESKILEGLKKDLIGMMQSDNIGALDVKEGKITICTRTTKVFGGDYKEKEAELAALKTYLEKMGDFVISNVTHYLRVG